MRVVSWNMGCAMGKYRPTHADAWRYLLGELNPDVALLQEVVLGESHVREAGGTFVGNPAWGTHYDWGSGVLVPRIPCEPAVAVDRERVHSAAVIVETASGPVLAVSVHVSTGGDQAAVLVGVADALAASAASMPVIVAGDFDAVRRVDAKSWREFHSLFFEKMRVSGFLDWRWETHGREVQTFWEEDSSAVIQDDHLFVSGESLGAKVVLCEVTDNPFVRELSGHAPVVLEIDA